MASAVPLNPYEPNPPDPYRVDADAALATESTYVLNHADTFAVIDHWGDIGPGARGWQGIYHRDTRQISKLNVRLNGRLPILLNSTVTDDNLTLVADLTNAETAHVPKNVVHLRRQAVIHDGRCDLHFDLCNHDMEAREVDLCLSADADFRDIFEVRGLRRISKQPARTIDASLRGIEFAYAGLDGVRRSTQLSFSISPSHVDAHGTHFRFTLAPRQHARFGATMLFTHGASAREAAPYRQRVAPDHVEFWCSRLPRIETSYRPLNLWLNRSAIDVSSLITETPHGPYPYAGVPWYNAAFGRDGIITALQMLWVLPELAGGVLRFLAATQAKESDPKRDAEPGKIVHETRLGELAALGEVPFGRYYGAVDGTPLFIVLAGEYVRRTGDLDLIRELRPALDAALNWISEYGDPDRDGFVEYANRSGDGLTNQGWKDSVDSVSHADGALAQAPIALCEVQGYVFAAFTEAAHVLHLLGEVSAARALREKARALKIQFNRTFWLDKHRTYALALDGAKRPCVVHSSNAGQCLWTRIAQHTKAARLVPGLFHAPMFSGWGIRTLASTEARYNPLSYHNGSVWPHDNALIALGLARYGYTDLVARIFAAQLEAATVLPLHRLPELYCGFEQVPSAGPVPYPVACSPQAWAVGTVYMMLSALLGLEIDARHKTIAFHSTRLPPHVEWLRIRNWRVGEGACHLEFRRHGADIALNVKAKPQSWKVLTIK